MAIYLYRICVGPFRMDTRTMLLPTNQNQLSSEIMIGLVHTFFFTKIRTLLMKFKTKCLGNNLMYNLTCYHIDDKFYFR